MLQEPRAALSDLVQMAALPKTESEGLHLLWAYDIIRYLSAATWHKLWQSTLCSVQLALAASKTTYVDAANCTIRQWLRQLTVLDLVVLHTLHLLITTATFSV